MSDISHFRGKVQFGCFCHVKDMGYVSLCPSEVIKITLPLFCGGAKIPRCATWLVGFYLIDQGLNLGPWQ